MLNSFLSMQRYSSEQDSGHSSGPDQRKSGALISEDSPQGEWDKIAEVMMIKFGESGHPVFRSTSPLSRGVLESKGGRKLSTDYCADCETFETVFRTIISVNQFSLYGAVAEMCEDYESDHAGRTVVRGQSSPSFVPSVIKTNILLTDDLAQEEDLLERKRERIEKLWQQDRLSKFCTDAGFLTTVEVGQYFMTKDTEEFSQFTDSVACRECTLPRDEDSSEPKGWIRGNTKIGPVMEVTTCCQQSKNMEWKLEFESVNKDHSHSWVRISHGLNKLVTDLTRRTKTTKSRKPQKNAVLPAHHKNYIYWRENLDRYWTTKTFALRLTSVEETYQSSSSWKSGSRQWWNDWILENGRSSSESFCVLSSLVWRKEEEQHGRRRTQEKISVLCWFLRKNSEPLSSSMSFRTQSYWSFTTGQCRNSERFLQVH